MLHRQKTAQACLADPFTPTRIRFPIDCVSHRAVGIVKRLCRQAAKPYLPLRSSGISSFVTALDRVNVLRTPVLGE
jgi:hypothetical protein